MTIEWLHMPEGFSIKSAMEVNLLMMSRQDEFQRVPPGEYELSPKVKPRGYKSKRTMRVNEKGSAVISPNSNEKAVIHDVSSYKSKPETNSQLFLLFPGDIFILTGPNKDWTGALVHDIVRYTDKRGK